MFGLESQSTRKETTNAARLRRRNLCAVLSKPSVRAFRLEIETSLHVGGIQVKFEHSNSAVSRRSFLDKNDFGIFLFTMHKALRPFRGLSNRIG